MKDFKKNKEARKKKMWAKYRRRLRNLRKKPKKPYCYKSTSTPDSDDNEKYSRKVKHKKKLTDEE